MVVHRLARSIGPAARGASLVAEKRGDRAAVGMLLNGVDPPPGGGGGGGDGVSSATCFEALCDPNAVLVWPPNPADLAELFWESTAVSWLEWLCAEPGSGSAASDRCGMACEAVRSMLRGRCGLGVDAAVFGLLACRATARGNANSSSSVSTGGEAGKAIGDMRGRPAVESWLPSKMLAWGVCAPCAGGDAAAARLAGECAWICPFELLPHRDFRACMGPRTGLTLRLRAPGGVGLPAPPSRGLGVIGEGESPECCSKSCGRSKLGDPISSSPPSNPSCCARLNGLEAAGRGEERLLLLRLPLPEPEVAGAPNPAATAPEGRKGGDSVTTLRLLLLPLPFPLPPSMDPPRATLGDVPADVDTAEYEDWFESPLVLCPSDPRTGPAVGCMSPLPFGLSGLDDHAPGPYSSRSRASALKLSLLGPRVTMPRLRGGEPDGTGAAMAAAAGDEAEAACAPAAAAASGDPAAFEPLEPRSRARRTAEGVVLLIVVN